MKIDSIQGDILKLEQLDIVSGKPLISMLCVLDQLADIAIGDTIGSTKIDIEFQNIIMKRLEKLKNSGKWRPNAKVETIAWDMMKSSDFQDNKCAHGWPDLSLTFSIPIPNLEFTYQSPFLKVARGQMTFERCQTS